MNNPKNIVLVGFMGAGKTLIAQKLGARLKREVVSTDDLIVRKDKRPIVDIFRDAGEAYFRKVEKAVVAEISLQTNIIIDCGGGVVLEGENVAKLRRNGLLFYLAATPEAIYQRIKHQAHRPLLNIENPKAKIEELLIKRRPFYEQADCVIETTGKSPDQVCDEIVAVIF